MKLFSRHNVSAASKIFLTHRDFMLRRHNFSRLPRRIQVQPKFHTKTTDFFVVRSFRAETEDNKKKRLEAEKKVKAEERKMRQEMGLTISKDDDDDDDDEASGTLAVPWHPFSGAPVLPYDLVEASKTYDIWSFGCMLYHMMTGTSLFKCNRDDDLASAGSMIDLLCWNEQRRREKLDDVKDELASQLLERILQEDHMKRPRNMAEVLDHGFFKHKLTAGISNDELLHKLDKRFDEQEVHFNDIKSSQDEILLNTHKIVELNFKLLTKVEQSTSTILKGVFEATEVLTPTCFVILPYKLQKQPEENPTTGQIENVLRVAGDSIEKARDFMDKLEDVEDAVNLAMEDPEKAAKGFFSHCKKRLTEKAEAVFDAKRQSKLYFYLVDEYTGEPCDGGVYPIEITTQSELCKKAVPFMKLGMKAVSVFNGAAAISTMCGCPILPVPPKLMKMGNDAIKKMDQESSVAEFAVVQKCLDSAQASNDEKGSDSVKVRESEREREREREKGSGGQRRSHLNRAMCYVSSTA